MSQRKKKGQPKPPLSPLLLTATPLQLNSSAKLEQKTMPHNLQHLAAINAAFILTEVARHKELLDWWLTVAGSATLLAMNLLRIYRMLRNQQPKSEKPKKGKRKG